jgi:cardiolipin synthetase 2 (EC 2.7.8.-)
MSFDGFGAVDIILAINVFFILTVVIFERRNPTATMTWVLAMVFIPVVGFVLYLFIGQDLRKKRLFYLKEEEEHRIYELLHAQDESLHNKQLQFHNPQIADYSDLIHLHLNSDRSLLTQDNIVQIFNDGEQLFGHLLSRLKQARRFIYVQTYILRDDQLGRKFRQVICDKAREGVEVNLLYDGMGCRNLSRKYFKPLREAGVNWAVFFKPFLPYINLRINYRNHRKICVIDGEEAYVGGFNIGDEYLGLVKKFGYWRDTHLWIKGGAVDSLQLRFLLDWRYASGRDYVFDKDWFQDGPGQGDTGVQIVTSGPDSKWSSIKHGYLRLFTKAQKNIYIQTPYFVPDEAILEALKIASLSGVDVRLMIPSVKDHPFVHWASLSYAGELLDAGARVFYYQGGFFTQQGSGYRRFCFHGRNRQYGHPQLPAQF